MNGRHRDENGRRRGGGGRGGQLRLALLLSVIWVAAAPPHDSTRPARWWAELMGLPDPGSAGARRVLNAMRELHERRFLVMEGGKDGQPPTVRLLDESGSGLAYELPYRDDEVSYVRVPHQLWTRGLIGDLKGPGLAVYLCVLSHYNHGDPKEIWFSKRGFHDFHGLGETTRLNGTTELLDAGVLTAREVSIDSMGGSDYRTHRRRLLSIEQPFVPPPPAQRPRV